MRAVNRAATTVSTPTAHVRMRAPGKAAASSMLVVLAVLALLVTAGPAWALPDPVLPDLEEPLERCDNGGYEFFSCCPDKNYPCDPAPIDEQDLIDELLPRPLPPLPDPPEQLPELPPIPEPPPDPLPDPPPVPELPPGLPPIPDPLPEPLPDLPPIPDPPPSGLPELPPVPDPPPGLPPGLPPIPDPIECLSDPVECLRDAAPSP